MRKGVVRLGFMGVLFLAILGCALLWLGYFARDPVADFPATGPRPPGRPVAALLLSGDMGLKVGMGPEIAAALTRQGIAVVGVNSLAYFRQDRSEAEIGAMIAGGINRARALGRADSVILIGQSFGADMLHIGLARLAPAQRKYVRMAILIVPTMPIYRQISLGELTGLGTPAANATATVARLDWTPVLCVYGMEEEDSVCPSLTLPNVQRRALPGGHRLRFDPAALIGLLRSAIDNDLRRGA